MDALPPFRLCQPSLGQAPWTGIELKDRPVYIGYAPWWGLTQFPGYIQHVRISNIARNDFPYARITVEPSVAAGSLASRIEWKALSPSSP